MLHSLCDIWYYYCIYVLIMKTKVTIIINKLHRMPDWVSMQTLLSEGKIKENNYIAIELVSYHKNRKRRQLYLFRNRTNNNINDWSESMNGLIHFSLQKMMIKISTDYLICIALHVTFTLRYLILLLYICFNNENKGHNNYK